MALARVVYEGNFYFITCAPSLDAARSTCSSEPKRLGWSLCPTPRHPDERTRPNPHECTCIDRKGRGSCRHYQFQSPTKAPKP